MTRPTAFTQNLTYRPKCGDQYLSSFEHSPSMYDWGRMDIDGLFAQIDLHDERIQRIGGPIYAGCNLGVEGQPMTIRGQIEFRASVLD